MRSKDKRKITKAFNKAVRYHAVKYPAGLWVCTLFDENDQAFIEIQYYEDKDRWFMEEQFEKLRNKNNEKDITRNI